MSFRLSSLILALLLCLAAIGVSAQQPADAAAQTRASQSQTPADASATREVPKTPEEIQREKEIEKKEQSQKALGIVPMFSVTDRQNAPPLSPGAKFHLMTRTFTDPFIYVAVAAQAGLGQANNSFAEYGQGASGYGKRYAANFADSASSNFFCNFFYPVLFKQDPRYFRMGEGPIKKRMWYAVEQVFLSRQDSGRRTFSYSNVLGGITAGTLSNAYYPQEDRGVGLTASRTGIAFLYGGLGNLAVEFWPDIDRHVIHKNKNQKPAPMDQPTEPTVK